MDDTATLFSRGHEVPHTGLSVCVSCLAGVEKGAQAYVHGSRLWTSVFKDN